MATTIFYNGRVISRPGAYSKVDASGLEQVGLGASGIVALVGTAEGGRPVSEITKVDQFMRFTNPEQIRDALRDGNLREAAAMAFEPSSDGEIQAGAQEVVAMKVNPSTQSTAVLPNAQGDAIDLTSADYGAFTEQVNVSIKDGTTQGKLVTVIFEDVTESVDDLGGDDIFKLTYDETNQTAGWDTMTGQVNSGGVLQADGTRDEAGLDSDIGTQLGGDGTIQVVSANNADNSQTITVYGLDSGGDPISEELALNGTTPVPGTKTFSVVYGAKLDAATAGNVSVDPSGGGADILTLTAATTETGMVLGIAMFVANGKVTVVADGAETGALILEGTNTVGAVILEKLTMNGTTPVVSTADFSKVTGIVLGNIAAARTITHSATALKSTASVQKNLQQLADFVNAKVDQSDGFTLTIETGETAFLLDNLDVSVSSVSIDNPANPGFKADLYAVINWFNTNSQLVTAARSSGATGGAPSSTSTPLFLSGGVEGTPTSSDWQSALNWLKQIRVNTVVVLTGDAAIHAKLDAHCAYMCGIGRSERDGLVGLQNSGETDVPTKSEVKSQIIDLNSRHIRACTQAIERFNIAGERTRFQPYFTAVIGAGMQAGSSVGTSLTSKQPNVLAFDQDSSWNPVDDVEEMIQAGAFFMENVEGVGRRWVRNVTTYLTSDNLAFTEGSVNEAANYATYTFRTAMEFAVGRKGFAGTENAAKGIAIKELNLLIDETILVAQRGLNVSRAADVLEVSVQMAPVIPINFIKNNIHLVIA